MDQHQPESNASGYAQVNPTQVTTNSEAPPAIASLPNASQLEQQRTVNGVTTSSVGNPLQQIASGVGRPPPPQAQSHPPAATMMTVNGAVAKKKEVYR